MAPDSVDTNGMVNIAPERVQDIGARTEAVSKRALSRTLRAPARAEIDESALRDINIKAGAGYITKLYANYEGKSFRKGEPLMTRCSARRLVTNTNPDYIQGLSWMESFTEAGTQQ